MMSIWICRDLDFEWGRQLGDTQAAAAELEWDLQIEHELGPWPSRDGWTEEIDVERIPLHLLEYHQVVQR